MTVACCTMVLISELSGQHMQQNAPQQPPVRLSGESVVFAASIQLMRPRTLWPPMYMLLSLSYLQYSFVEAEGLSGVQKVI